MDDPDSQFLPTSLTNMRRTSTGSLTRKRTSTTNSYDYASCSNYREYVTARSRKKPITGRSWDDNSLGHGSVAARMRRDRNKAVQRTQSTATYTSHKIDTQANIASTLNLINTTSLSSWNHDDKLPWDEGYDLTPVQAHTAASRRTAGSLCNISSTMPCSAWDSRSIPECSRPQVSQRGNFRHSFTSAYHHSSPTSGCASIASSDIDSADMAFFSMNDDSSLFDGDSLFSDSLFSESFGVMDTDSGFSTNIFSLLEEGSISCRTPFLNGDWPDSMSELDFDCRGQRTDVSNCDAHSDIGPSCSVPTDRNKLKKRQIRAMSKPTVSDTTQEQCSPMDLRQGASMYLNKPTSSLCTMQHVEQPTDLLPYALNNPLGFDSPMSTGDLGGNADINPAPASRQKQLGLRLMPVVADTPNYFAGNGGIDAASVEDEEGYRTDEPNTPVVESKMLVLPVEPPPLTTPPPPPPPPPELTPAVPTTPAPPRVPGTYQATDQTRKFASTNLDAPVQVQLQVNSPKLLLSTATSTSACGDGAGCGAQQSSKVPIVLSINNWNGMPPEERLGFIEQLSERINKTMGLQEQLKIVNIIGAGHRPPVTSMSVDDIDSHKLSRELGKLNSTAAALTSAYTEPLGATPQNQPSPSKSADEPRYVGKQQQDISASTSGAGGGSGGLRRSNSDGNLPKTLSDAQKDHRRRQRQARKWAKLMKQRQRKENRQQIKEHKSGLFVNEKKVKLQVESEEEIDVTDI